MLTTQCTQVKLEEARDALQPSASYLDERMLTYEPIVLFVSCAFIKI